MAVQPIHPRFDCLLNQLLRLLTLTGRPVQRPNPKGKYAKHLGRPLRRTRLKRQPRYWTAFEAERWGLLQGPTMREPDKSSACISASCRAMIICDIGSHYAPFFGNGCTTLIHCSTKPRKAEHRRAFVVAYHYSAILLATEVLSAVSHRGVPYPRCSTWISQGSFTHLSACIVPPVVRAVRRS